MESIRIQTENSPKRSSTAAFDQSGIDFFFFWLRSHPIHIVANFSCFFSSRSSRRLLFQLVFFLDIIKHGSFFLLDFTIIFCFVLFLFFSVRFCARVWLLIRSYNIRCVLVDLWHWVDEIFFFDFFLWLLCATWNTKVLILELIIWLRTHPLAANSIDSAYWCVCNIVEMNVFIITMRAPFAQPHPPILESVFLFLCATHTHRFLPSLLVLLSSSFVLGSEKEIKNVRDFL